MTTKFRAFNHSATETFDYYRGFSQWNKVNIGKFRNYWWLFPMIWDHYIDCWFMNSLAIDFLTLYLLYPESEDS